MRRERLKLCGAVVGFLTCAGGASAQPPEEPGRALPPPRALPGLRVAGAQPSEESARLLPPPPMPMAGRVFPVYPLYPAYGAVPIAYAGETFAAADRTGYFLYAAPANYWSVPDRGWKSVPHPQAAEIAARFSAPGVTAADCALRRGGHGVLVRRLPPGPGVPGSRDGEGPARRAGVAIPGAGPLGTEAGRRGPGGGPVRDGDGTRLPGAEHGIPRRPGAGARPHPATDDRGGRRHHHRPGGRGGAGSRHQVTPNPAGSDRINPSPILPGPIDGPLPPVPRRRRRPDGPPHR